MTDSQTPTASLPAEGWAEIIAYHEKVAANQLANLESAIAYEKANPWASSYDHAPLRDSIAFHKRAALALAAAPPASAGLAGRETHEFDIRERDATDPPPEAVWKELREAAEAFIWKWDEALPHIQAQDGFCVAHEFTYGGPQIANFVEDLRLALAGASQP